MLITLRGQKAKVALFGHQNKQMTAMMILKLVLSDLSSFVV